MKTNSLWWIYCLYSYVCLNNIIVDDKQIYDRHICETLNNFEDYFQQIMDNNFTESTVSSTAVVSLRHFCCAFFANIIILYAKNIG